MAFVIADRVRETTTTTGTGNLTLDGAVSKFRTFASVLSSSDTTYYSIVEQTGTAWEVGIGTFTSPATLARTTILSSSSGGSAVNFGAGTKDVFITLPAPRTVTSVSGGSTGLTPSSPTYGDVTLAGTLAAASGGTGQTSYAVGDLLYASTTTALSKLADVATGNALISGGVGVAPSYGKIGLTTHVSGTLPVANGGTGTTTAFTAGSVVFAGASGVYSQDNANLFWDDANNRLGVGTTTPAYSIDTPGTVSAAIIISTNLKHASSASNNIVLDSSGNATFAGTAVPASSFLRNRIINGDMRIDQRNAGASITPVNLQYSVDRFGCELTQASKYSAQQNAGAVTPPAGFTNYIGATSLSAYSSLSTDSFTLFQRIEGYNTSDLAWGSADAKTVTISFWVRSSLTGTFGGSLRNSAADRSYVFSYSISAANTWEQKSVTVSGDTTGTWLTTNGVGISVFFDIGSGSNLKTTAGAWAAGNYKGVTGGVSVVGTNGATFYLTGVQLEVGTAATPFERRQYGQELMLCQRYYEANVNTSGAGAGCAAGFSGSVTSGIAYYAAVSYLVWKRAAPTITLYNANLAAFPSASIAQATGTTSFLMAGTANGTNTGGYYFYDFAASAEL